MKDLVGFLSLEGLLLGCCLMLASCSNTTKSGTSTVQASPPNQAQASPDLQSQRKQAEQQTRPDVEKQRKDTEDEEKKAHKFAQANSTERSRAASARLGSRPNSAYPLRET